MCYGTANAGTQKKLAVQVLMLSNFQGWPSAAITVEFWMWSVDTCRWGSPVSYAAGSYESADNTFLLFNYNDWCDFACSILQLTVRRAV